MKNEDIFIGQVFQITKVTKIPGKITGYLDNPILEYFLTEKEIVEAEVVKIALLRKKQGSYYDLETKKEYRKNGKKVGDMFISKKQGILIPINQILPENEKGKNLTKRKALKRFQEVKNNSNK